MPTRTTWTFTGQLLACMSEPWRRTLAAIGDRYQAGRLKRIQLPSHDAPPVGGLRVGWKTCGLVLMPEA